MTRYTLPTASSQRVPEVRALTGLRGIAAIYVVLFHYFTPVPAHMPGRLLLLHGYMAVDFFFCLSGFVMALNYSGLFIHGAARENYYIYLTRRIARIYPLYLVTLFAAAWLVIHGLLEYRTQSPFTSFIANILMVQNWGPWNSINVPSWSISTEFFSYLLFPFLVSFFLYRSPRINIAAACVCIAALTVLFVYSLHVYDQPKLFDRTAGLTSLVRCVAEFLLGVAGYRFLSAQGGRTIRNSPWVAYLLAGVFLVLFLIRDSDLAIVLLIPFFIVALSGSTNLITRFLGSRPLEYLGVLSYSLYLLHSLFNAPLGWLDEWAAHHGSRHSHFVATMLVFPLLFGASALTYRFIELPGRTFLRSFFEKNHPPT